MLKLVARLLAVGYTNLLVFKPKGEFRGLIHEKGIGYFEDKNLFEIGSDFVVFMEKQEYKPQFYIIFSSIFCAIVTTFIISKLDPLVGDIIIIMIGCLGGFITLFISARYIVKPIFLRNK